MPKINTNFLKLPGNYLFAEIANRVANFKNKNPEADIIRLGIGDVTQPLPAKVIETLHEAVNDMSSPDTFKGYGPDYGYTFLIDEIIKFDFKNIGIDLDVDEVFISDGSKCDVGNIQEIFSADCKVAITDPVYPVYLDTNVMAGRAGDLKEDGTFENIVYLKCNAENNFIPELPKEKVDLIYLCYPNNPTGTTLTKEQLKKWVDYAKKTDAIILYDAAYEAYITDPNIPRSIYEIEGAKDVALEFRSFSKTAGFTGTRCAYTIVPKTVFGKVPGNEEKYPLNALWKRRQSTKFNGTSYIIQKAAAATYTAEGRAQVKLLINYYMTNAKIIKEGLESLNFKVFGGVNAPYIWLKTPNNLDSWAFFDKLLSEAHIVGTPGAGFGPSGQGYFRLTAFGSKENTERAVERIKTRLKL